MGRLPRRTSRLLSAFERGRQDSCSGHIGVLQVPYKDPERAEAWERGWRFQRELIDRPAPKKHQTHLAEVRAAAREHLAAVQKKAGGS